MSKADQASPRDVIRRFYAAEAAYMNAGGMEAGASFADMAATLDPDVVLHQSPDLPWGEPWADAPTGDISGLVEKLAARLSR